MKVIIATALLAAAAQASILSEDEFAWVQYVSEHGKHYSTVQEYEMRQALWKDAHAYISMHNANTHKTSIVGHNFMSDWTEEEKAKLRGLTNIPKPPQEANPEMVKWFEPANGDTVNQINQGAVTPVKNQGACGSCYAFSSTGALEGAYVKAGGQLTGLSEQQLVDCSSAYGNLQCDGGWYYWSWDYWKQNAAETDYSYPYQSSDGRPRSCRVDPSLQWLNVGSYHKVTHNNPDQLKAAIADRPVSVALDASSHEFGYYTNGVVTGAGCGTSINHAVLAVGYGTMNGVEYFLIKNSWGKTWGDGGYVRVGVSSGKGTCGVNMYPYVVYV